MPTYRKMPVEIEARKFYPPRYFISDQEFLDHVDHLAEWCDGVIGEDEIGLHILINTLEGTMTAEQECYIIKGVQGEFYPCAANIFEATYERVDQ